jgi:putative tryptophan/tyrosine transport system substrate-binding protein
MQRRKLLGVLGSAAAAWPAIARAQQAGPARRIGILMGGSKGDSQNEAGLAAFMKALKELGWTDGQNIKIDIRWAAGNVERMKELAKELVSLQSDLLVGHTTQPVAALQRETTTIPIVFLIVSDPVGSGFVANFSRPGGNITGFVNIEASLGGKWIEVLKDIVPSITRAALMFNPDTANYFRFYLEPFEVAARLLGIEPITAPVRTAADFERVISSLAERPGAGLAVMPDVALSTQKNRDLIISLAARHRLLTIYPYRYWVGDGGLVSYGIDQVDLYRRVPTYIDRIFKGAKPAELPVQLPTRFEMAVNLKTAKALGLTISPSLLARADEVIES